MRALRAAAVSLAVMVLGAAAFAALDFQEGRGLRQLGEKEKVSRVAQQVLARWPQDSRLTAIQYLDAYGAPDEVSDSSMVWRRKGDYLWVAVRRDKSVARDEGLVQHAVRYDTATSPQNDLRRMKAGVQYEPIGGVLVAASDSEPANILALNLAADVIEGHLSAEEARARYTRTLSLAASGKSSESTKRLMFKPVTPVKRRQPGQIGPRF